MAKAEKTGEDNLYASFLPIITDLYFKTESGIDHRQEDFDVLALTFCDIYLTDFDNISRFAATDDVGQTRNRTGS
jgi:hypothetical protein